MSFVVRTARLNQLLSANRLHKVIALVQSQQMHNRALIGSRDVVGYGFNGSYFYYDATDMPYPAIRFREETEEIKKLREKEKGDWNKLTLDEKKKRKFFRSSSPIQQQMIMFILQCIDTAFA